MTLSEFKAWFEGFTEGMSRAPTEAQWKRIKARVKEIDGSVTTERIFVDRYWPPSTPWRYVSPTWVTSPTTIYCSNTSGIGSNAGTYSATSAMYLLGQNDAQAIASS